MHGLSTPLKEVLGGNTAKALDKAFGIVTVEDLLRHFPRRYANRGELTDMAGLTVDEHVTIMADVMSVTLRPMRARKGDLLEVLVTDGTGSLKLTFFNQKWRERDLKVGRRGLFSGKVTVFNNSRQLAHPTYVLVPSDTEPDPEAVQAFARALIPVYPATSTLSSWVIERSVERLAHDGARAIARLTDGPRDVREVVPHVDAQAHAQDSVRPRRSRWASSRTHCGAGRAGGSGGSTVATTTTDAPCPGASRQRWSRSHSCNRGIHRPPSRAHSSLPCQRSMPASTVASHSLVNRCPPACSACNSARARCSFALRG